jgi:AAA domain
MVLGILSGCSSFSGPHEQLTRTNSRSSARTARQSTRKKKEHVRVTILLREATLSHWFGEGGCLGLTNLPLRTGCHYKVIHTRVSDSLAEHFEKESWWECYGSLKWKDHTCFDEPDEWFLAGAATEADLNQIRQLGEIANWSARSMAQALRRQSLLTKAPANCFLVPGLIPDGSPTLLLGDKKTGKSTALLELCVAVARRESSWLGFPINHDRRGFAVYICGEDSPGEVLDRVRRMTGGETPFGLNIIPAFGTDLDNILKQLESENVRLLAVDPARKFFKGDEDSSDQVSDFFNRIESLTAKKNCATIATHHLKRESHPGTVAEVAHRVRGSGVWLERPRVVLGMVRTGAGETHFGISGPPDVPLHNFRRDVMFNGVRRLRREDATSRHVDIGGTESSKARQALAIKEKEAVLSAMKSVLMSGERITRTGHSELYKHAPTEIRGWGRAKTRNAVEELIGDGQLLLNSDGSLGIIGSSAVGTRTDA